MTDLSQAIQYLRRITATVLDPEQATMPKNLADMCVGFDMIDRALSTGAALPSEWEADREPMWAVNATYSRDISPVESRNGQIPTFYLDPRVQGILNEKQAMRIALDILRKGTDDADGVHYFVSVYEV
jgi:hypothetical protein